MRLSPEGRAVHALLTGLVSETAEVALDGLPAALQARLDALPPLNCVHEIHAPLITFCRDRGDNVVPVGESRRLRAALSGRAGVRYVELAMFKHATPRRLTPLRLLRELRGSIAGCIRCSG